MMQLKTIVLFLVFTKKDLKPLGLPLGFRTLFFFFEKLG